MQATRSSRWMHQLSWEVSIAVRAGAPAVGALTRRNVAQTARQRQASPVSTSTPSRSLGHAARQLTTACTTTQPQPALTRILSRASGRNRSEHVLWHGTCLCRSSSSSSSNSTASGSAVLPRGACIGRGPREKEVPSAAATVARRGMSSSTMSEREFHFIADEALEDIHDAVEEALEEGFAEEFDCNMSQGVLNIIVGDRGTWVLNKQSPNRQIWWSSPVSGPMRFEYHDDSKRWLNTRDGKTDLRDLLAAEMSEKCGVSLT